MARIIEVIELDFCRGKGTPDDPCRTVIQYWFTDGRLLREIDTHLDSEPWSDVLPDGTKVTCEGWRAPKRGS